MVSKAAQAKYYLSHILLYLVAVAVACLPITLVIAWGMPAALDVHLTISGVFKMVIGIWPQIFTLGSFIWIPFGALYHFFTQKQKLNYKTVMLSSLMSVLPMITLTLFSMIQDPNSNLNPYSALTLSAVFVFSSIVGGLLVHWLYQKLKRVIWRNS